MANWEYAYICYSARHGVQTWLPASSNGTRGRTQEIPRKGDINAIIRQEIARLCEEGWEIFQVSTAIPAISSGYASRSQPDSPRENVYHFRRQP